MQQKFRSTHNSAKFRNGFSDFRYFIRWRELGETSDLDVFILINRKSGQHQNYIRCAEKKQEKIKINTLKIKDKIHVNVRSHHANISVEGRPLTPHFHILTLGFTGVYIIFFRLWVPVRTAIEHYANMSVQYSAFFKNCKNDNFQMKNSDIFLIFAQNIDCGYTLEPLHPC